MTFKLIAFNIYNGGIDAESSATDASSSSRARDIAKFLSRQSPDVVALTELNHWTQEALGAHALSWGHGFAVLMHDTNTPFRIGLTSKYPILHADRRSDGFWHGMLAVQLDVAGLAGMKNLGVVVTHLNPFAAAARTKEAHAIGQYVRDNPGLPWIVTGDFNSLSQVDVPYYVAAGVAANFRASTKLSAKFLGPDSEIDYSTVGTLAAYELADLCRPTGSTLDHSVPTSLEVDLMHAVHMRLDYAFGSREISGNGNWSAQVIRTPETDMLSDHYPLAVVYSTP